MYKTYRINFEQLEIAINTLTMFFIYNEGKLYYYRKYNRIYTVYVSIHFI